MKIILVIMSLLVLLSCNQKENSETSTLGQEWFDGKAEITSYDLIQARYGQTQPGEAVLVFVTENLLEDGYVKPDSLDDTKKNILVLKMNFTKKFITGIYPYSMMLSVFTPVAAGGNHQTVKASCSVQEWCGHCFSQLTLDGQGYQWQLHSYFEKEGEQSAKISPGLLEDEIWTRIRINPETLPQGKITVIPGLFRQRMSHTILQPEEALATRSAADSFFIQDSTALMYSLNYPVSQRSLQVYYRPDPPHEILGWQESYPDAFGDKTKMLTTTATRKKTIWLDYWKYNGPDGSKFRDSLELMHYAH